MASKAKVVALKDKNTADIEGNQPHLAKADLPRKVRVKRSFDERLAVLLQKRESAQTRLRKLDALIANLESQAGGSDEEIAALVEGKPPEEIQAELLALRRKLNLLKAAKRRVDG